jgi:hypothetical protein
MKLEFKCKVESKTYIGSSVLETTIADKDFILIPDEKSLLKEIIIRVKIKNPNDIISKISPSNIPGVNHDLTIKVGEEIDNEITELLQYLEASLSFLGNLKKIYWEEPKLIFIPENDEDKINVNVMSFAVHKKYPDVEKILTMDAFRNIVSDKKKYEFLTIVKSFFREGLREFESFRYINAFYNFYFVIEDLYGKGKTKNYEIEEEFKKNKTFREFIEWMITKQISGRHKVNIEKFISEEHKSYDIDGLIELIVKVRGNLHHFSSKSSKRKGTPLNNKDFESMAFLLLGLSNRSILQKIYERNKGII